MDGKIRISYVSNILWSVTIMNGNVGLSQLQNVIGD